MRGKIEEYVFDAYSKLNETDLEIWRTVKENRFEVPQMTIDQLAKLANVSRTTISRFVTKLGLSGYSEFKVLMSIDNANKPTFDSRVYEDACTSIIQYIEEQKVKNYENVCQLLFESERIFVYGSGDIQSTVGRQMKRMFASCGELIYNVEGSTFDKSLYDVITEKDVVILISLSGNNEAIIDVAKTLKLKGAKVISFTEFKNNILSDLSDEKLYISSKDLNFIEHHPSYKLTMLYFVMMELLFIKYAIYKQNKEHR
ncbi:MurR/RpiR family transcriptional regulator [Tuanshanicoccus lijuaniae]|uniref:MurR/RpiR family transcriptional regulator n=1 Tax=Aerococcaceae bacterium zg-1292 TaxID=2774330 RepID=UPI001937CBE9|nr:MurR/RpiR family transcriptional regulator [Aerococcaceae bacterium zg-1292]QQA37052.1 MurR/RpiR family transcriptional regulator [Aerococcaceae bacterium zg-1292]